MSERITPDKMREYLRMYLVMGSVNCTLEPTQILKEAIAGGLTIFQFREKGVGALRGEPMKALALELQDLCLSAGVPFIVNDNVELALELNADGVHIGQDDESAKWVRDQIGNRILGVSVHTVEEAHQANLHGADYLGIGPIYPTTSKDDAKAVQGTAIIPELRHAGIKLPIVGIGGITIDHTEEVIRAGADGVAVISAVTQAERVRASVEEIRRKVDLAQR